MARMTGLLVGALIGSIVSWVIIDLLWLWFAGGHIPIAALSGAIIFIILHGLISKNELTKASQITMAAEAWAIILVGIYLVFIPDVVRWY